MSFIYWDDSFSVGVEIIDSQHKKLVELINNFHNSETNLDEVVQDLLAYINFHFKTEEKYFIDFGYQKIDEHTNQHKFYEDKIKEIYKKCLDEKVDEGKISSEIEGFIKDWILNHIKISDKEYTECFHKHGLK